jgi:hypothetical protein
MVMPMSLSFFLLNCQSSRNLPPGSRVAIFMLHCRNRTAISRLLPKPAIYGQRSGVDVYNQRLLFVPLTRCRSQ